MAARGVGEAARGARRKSEGLPVRVRHGDAGRAQQPLARRANAHHHVLLAVLLAQRAGHGFVAQAAIGLCIKKARAVFIEAEDGGRIGRARAGEHDGPVPRRRQTVGGHTARVGLFDPARQRTQPPD